MLSRLCSRCSNPPTRVCSGSSPASPRRIGLRLCTTMATLIYTYVPGGKRRIRDQLPGAAAVVAVWTLFSKIFSFNIGHFWKLSYIYGSLAAIVLITLWLNVNINVLFLGAGLNAKIQGMGQEKKEPDV